MSDLVGNPEDRFSRDAAHLCITICFFQLFGIPQHYGIFYAMGFALCMEGFMSGCYHVCPTVSNFQFGKLLHC